MNTRFEPPTIRERGQVARAMAREQQPTLVELGEDGIRF